MSIYAGVSSMMEMESHSGLMDPADDKFTKLIQEMDDFKNKFSPIPDARLSTGNGPHQDHLQEPSSAAAEAMITDSPILTEAEHCSHITAAQTQLKDREKAVDMMQQIIRHQGVLIDEGLMKPTALKPTLEGLKKAEDALAETTKRYDVTVPLHFYIAIPMRERTQILPHRIGQNTATENPRHHAKSRLVLKIYIAEISE
ncbi:hypothetical protein CDAR_493521 [Caerostris darwini]|uniref:Uncharacterized protein n=1 Tax=Caerostris darwini TaxID=1538125 RepID=A0AAV4VSS5_9ARAC|nr:hypothetical protein CDAR_493521 [Caerostris darwini]